MDTTGPEILTRDELVARARALASALRSRAEEAERNRIIPVESIDEMREAGLFRALQPRKYGGFEHDFNALAEITFELARGCASSGWLGGLAIGNQWLAGLFPEAAQDEIWGADPDAIVFAVFTVTTTAEKAQGGYRFSGSWGFASGCEIGQWFCLGLRLPPEDGDAPATPAIVMVRAGDYSVEDDWFASGLVATGSKRVVCEDVFVPAHRTLTFAEFATGTTPGSRLYDNRVFALPALVVLPSILCMPALGALQGAIDDFVGRVGKRQTLSGFVAGGDRVGEFATVQSRIGGAAAALAAGKALIEADLAETHALALRDEPITVDRRIRSRLVQAYVADIAVRGIDGLFRATGGAGLYLGEPIQRAWRDIHAVSHHASLNWDAVSTMYGQHALGLEPIGRY